jgi:hypothetical protein
MSGSAAHRAKAPRTALVPAFDTLPNVHLAALRHDEAPLGSNSSKQLFSSAYPFSL